MTSGPPIPSLARYQQELRAEARRLREQTPGSVAAVIVSGLAEPAGPAAESGPPGVPYLYLTRCN